MSEVFEPLRAVFTSDMGKFLKGVEQGGKAAEDWGKKVTAASDAAARAQISAGEAALRAADAQKKAADTAAKYAAGEIKDSQAVADAATRAGLAQERAALTASAAQRKQAEVTTASADAQGAKLAETGAAFTRFGKLAAVGLIAAAAGSVYLAGSFQKQTSVLVTAAGEQASNLATVRNGILQIASTTGTSWQNLTAGEYTLEKAGYRGAASLTVLRAASQGAKEENADLGTVTNAMTSIMASYHLRTSQSVQVMNALKTAAGESKTTMEGYASALSTVLPVASANKVGFAQVAGAIATLTQHGTSAQESTFELANTIRSLAAPNRVAANELQQLGLNVTDVSTHLGSRGLTGTIDLLVGAITKKMGPAGTVLLNSFNQSKTASADADTMIAKMPASVAAVARQYQAGSITLLGWRDALKALPAPQAALATQFKATEDRARGFNMLLRAGDPAAQTFTNALKAATGGATGMNTVLQLSGGSAAGFKDRVDAVSSSLSDGAANVEGWAATQQLFNTRLDMAKQTAEALAIRLGTALLPAFNRVLGVLMSVVTWLEKHTTTAKILAGVVGGVLLVAIAAYAVSMATAAAATIAATWPILAIIAAVTAVAVGIYELWTHWDEVWNWIWHHKAYAAIIAILALPLVPIFALVAAVHYLWSNWNSIWSQIKTVTSAVWSFIGPIFDAIKAVGLDSLTVAIDILKGDWSGAWSAVQAAVMTVWNVIRPILSAISGAVGDVAGSIGKLGGAAKDIGGAITNPGHAIGSALGHIGLSSGGMVPGTGNSDSVPAMLTPGEFVIRKDSATKLGKTALAKMNAGHANLETTAKGGGGGGLAGVIAASTAANLAAATAKGPKLTKAERAAQTYAHHASAAHDKALSSELHVIVSGSTANHQALTKATRMAKAGELEPGSLSGLTKKLESERNLAEQMVKLTKGTRDSGEAARELTKASKDLATVTKLAKSVNGGSDGTDLGTVIAKDEKKSGGRRGTAHNGFGINTAAYGKLVSERGGVVGKSATAKAVEAAHKTSTASDKKLAKSLATLNATHNTGKQHLFMTGKHVNVAIAAHGTAKGQHLTAQQHKAVAVGQKATADGHREDQKSQHKELMAAHKQLLTAHKATHDTLADMVRALGSEKAEILVDGDKLTAAISRKILAKVKTK